MEALLEAVAADPVKFAKAMGGVGATAVIVLVIVFRPYVRIGNFFEFGKKNGERR